MKQFFSKNLASLTSCNIQAQVESFYSGDYRAKVDQRARPSQNESAHCSIHTPEPRLYWHLCSHNANSRYVQQYYRIIFKVALWNRPPRWFPTLKPQWSATVPEQIEDQIHGEGSLGRLSCESYLNVNWISHAFDE